MFIIILNLLNLFIFLNIYSFYNNFVLNTEVLLFFIFIFIILNIFIFIYNIVSDFIILKKDEVLKEYYLGLFELYNLLLIFKEKLFFIKRILKKFYNYLKYIIFILNFNFKFFLKNIKNLYIYIYNNVLYINFLNLFFFKKKIYNFFLNIKKNYIILLISYINLSSRLNSSYENKDEKLSFFFIRIWLYK